MEVGQSIVSTEEYLRLKEIQKKYLKVNQEFEEKADKIIIDTLRDTWGDLLLPSRERITFVGKDTAICILQDNFNKRLKRAERSMITTFGARLRFLFTGQVQYQETE